jgi:molecular chaperone GrpE
VYKQKKIDDCIKDIIMAKTKKQKNHNTDKCEELKDQLLRVNADFQNFKKRQEKEKEEWFEIAQGSIIKSFLPIIDDFELAMKNMRVIKEEKEKKAWGQGFEILYKKFEKVLQDVGVEKIKTDIPFDPEFHEALMQVDSKEHKSGQIVNVLSSGYTFKGKVLRVAKVSVAK